MLDNARVRHLVEEVLESERTPEEVCRDTPDLLPAVRKRLMQVQRLDQQFDELFGEDHNQQATTPGYATEAELPEISGYQVEAVIGRGGMGVVFRARHLKLNRTVAVKMVRAGAYACAEELARFRREAEAVAALRHPNIVQVHDAGEVAGHPYFTMEYVEGGTLAASLANNPISPRHAAELLAILASAVQFAHQSGFLHRDLKPANILLTPDGVPRITDFGLARAVNADPELTGSGVPVGTPSYMAPEQARGHTRDIGPAVDIYALGAVLYEMLTGRPPFEGQSACEIVQKVVHEESTPPSRWNASIPRDLETICLKCLQKSPARRYASAQDLADDLHRFLDGKPVVARPISTLERTVKWIRRRPAAALLVGALLAALGAATGAGVWLWQQDLDRAAAIAQREARARNVLDAGLRRVDDLRREERWDDALQLLTLASDRVPEANSPLYEERFQQAQSDCRIAKDLETARENYPLLPNGQVDYQQRAKDFLKAFERAGFNLDAHVETAAARIRDSAIREQLVAALDESAVVAFMLKDKPLTEKFLTIARLADQGSSWRDRFRDSSLWGSRNHLQELAATAFTSTPPPSEHQLALLALLMKAEGDFGQTIYLLGESCRRQPRNFWVHREMGFMLFGMGRDRDGAGYFRAALALRPDNAAGHEGLALCMASLGQCTEAISAYRRAVECAPDSGATRAKLVLALAKAGYWIEAEAECRSALKADPTNYFPLVRLAEVLQKNGRLEEARLAALKAAEIAPDAADVQTVLSGICARLGRHEDVTKAYHKLIESKSMYSRVDHFLARELVAAGRWEEAITALQAAVARNDHPDFHLELGKIYREHGKTEAAIEAYRKVATFKNKAHLIWEGMAAIRLEQGRFGEARTTFESVLRLQFKDAERRARRRQLDLCNSLVAIESKLPAILTGKERPADASTQRALAEWCLKHKRLTAMAANLYVSAFTTQPSLADDLDAGNRFDGACAAALAGCGVGEDVAKVDGEERAALRKTAHDWLTAEHKAFAERHRLGKRGDRTIVATSVRSWLKSSDLTCVRDEPALDKLPAEEKRAWQALWKKIAELAARDPVAMIERAQAHVVHREWKQAARCYAEAMELEKTDDTDIWFEYAATHLLAEDIAGYRRACEHMLAHCQPKGPMRPYLVARAWTLTPVSEIEMKHLHVAESEVNRNQAEFLAATQLGAMMFRKDDTKFAARTLESGLVSEGRPGRAVLSWLWLAMCHHKTASPNEARRWLAKSTDWLDQQGGRMPLDPNTTGANRHNWLEAHVLRREVEALLASAK
jgi:serine/threonine-protein kinase